MKKLLKIFNHEIWKFCEICKINFDARANCSSNCPQCGSKTTK